MDQLSLLGSSESLPWQIARDTNVRIGVCSWADATLIDSGFYPPRVNTAEKRLRYYAEHFPIVEVDSTYYAIPDPQTAHSWAVRTPPDFKFNVKAFSLFTGHPTRPAGIPSDLRPYVDPNSTGEFFYIDSVEPALLTEIWSRFAYAVQPLVESGKLGVIMCQFPPWYTSSPETRTRVEACLEGLGEALPGVEACVEFRSASWMQTKSRQRRILNWLHTTPANYVAVDEPQGTDNSVPPVIDPAARIAVIRFHGRNRSAWTEPGVSVQERFRWEYSDDELGGWVPRVRELSGTANEVHVMMNNCHGDFSIKAANDFTRLYARR